MTKRETCRPAGGRGKKTLNWKGKKGFFTTTKKTMFSSVVYNNTTVVMEKNVRITKYTRGVLWSNIHTGFWIKKIYIYKSSIDEHADDNHEFDYINKSYKSYGAGYIIILYKVENGKTRRDTYKNITPESTTADDRSKQFNYANIFYSPIIFV